MGAGDYPDRLEHRARVRPGPNGFGEKIPDAFPLTGHLWGAVEDLAASREERLGSERQETRVVIRLRNYPNVRPQDRLGWAEWDELYVVESVRRGDNELVVEARRWSP